MKRILLLLFIMTTAVSFSQDLNSMTKSTSASSKLLNNDYLDKLASDQVEKLTKKLSLSDSQQKQASKLVMNQLRSDKFQEMLAKYTPDQLMSSAGSDQISQALMSDKGFQKGLEGMLTDEQKKTVKTDMVKAKG